MNYWGVSNDTLQALAHVATIMLTLISLVAVIFAYKQIRSTTSGQREVAANSIFVQYLQECLKFPEFIDADNALFDFNAPTFEAPTFKGSREKFAQYEAFVDIMLTSFEMIFEMGAEDDWKNEMREHFKGHRAYLESDYFRRYQPVFKSDFSRFLTAWLNEKNSKRPS